MNVPFAMRYFNEYMFYRALQEVNFNRRQKDLPEIRTSEARGLHAEVVKQANGDMEGLRRTGYMEILNDVFQESNGGPLYTNRDIAERYNGYVRDFSNYTGLKLERDPENPVVPLSPYDERFMHRATFLRNGNDLLFAQIRDLETEGYNDKGDFDLNENITLYKERPGMTSMGRAGTALCQDDLSGMSMLAPYMSKREYDSVAGWVNDVGKDNPDNYMSADAVERAVAILQELQNTGTEYSIETDSRVGQIRAKLAGTKMSVRLTDTRSDEQFVGRVYDDGVTYYYMSHDKSPRNGHFSAPYASQTTEDTIKLLRFAQGKPISDFSGKDVNGSYQYNERNKGQMQRVYSTYRSYGNLSILMGDDRGDNKKRVRLYANSSRSISAMRFQTSADAENALKTWVDSARENFVNEVNVDMLVQEAALHKGEEGYVPIFSGDAGIAAIQHSYWEVLNGRTTALLKPGYEADEYGIRERALKDWDLTGTVLAENMMSQIRYTGTPEEQVRAHLADNTDYLIGHFEPDSEGMRFNPVNVASYMRSANGRYRNNDDIISAIKSTDITADELKGTDFYNEALRSRLVKFDPESARPMHTVTHPFMQSMYSTIKDTLEQTGCTVDEDKVLLDKNGVVHYEVQLPVYKGVRNNGKDMATITGELGQIFAPDGKGMVETKFGGDNNYLFVPGYEAYVLPQKPGEAKTMEERTRLKGYEQIMKEAIQYRVRSDLLLTATDVGDSTSLNGVYRRLYDVRYPLDLFQQARMDGMSDELLDQIIETNARRVRYSNELREGSTINTEYRMSEQSRAADNLNDNFRDPYNLTGHRNVSVMTEQGDGYFDKSATGMSTNQGIIRYLVEGARVTSDGEIIPGDKDDKTPLMKNEACKYMDYIPFDRRQMTFNNLLKASCVTQGVHTAQMTFGGWTFDDGYVVSKNFADTYRIRGADGEMRSLVVGDKISDMNGNKGVIALVVDPDMDPEEAERQGISEPVAWFKANKGKLDVVGAPFPAPSRFNGGSARELMEHPSDLVGPDGQVYEGCIGDAKYIITHMAVDKKTHVYGEDELAKGKGRRASPQLAWALASMDATNVLDECYMSNNGAVTNLREMLLTCGLDMDETGHIRDEYRPHNGEIRRVFELPELRYKESKSKTRDGKPGKPILDVSGMKQDFNNIISVSGGILELPFPLKYPTGDMTPHLNEDKTGIIYDGSVEKPGETYGLPVMSAHLRSGQMFADDQVSVHDYTNQYIEIYKQALRYKDAEKNNDKEEMAKAKLTAQGSFNQITGDIVNRNFQGKHNVFRDSIMGNRMPHSATAVWTADPRLDIDEVAIGPNMKETLGVEKDGDYIAVWRDPVLRDAGVRYMKVKVDDRLVGCAINPVMDKGFDGDFDGDSVGLMALQSKAAKKEAMEKLTIGANLLDFGSRRDDNPKSPYGLMMQDGLDLKSAEYVRPELKERRSKLEARANDLSRAKYNSEALSRIDIFAERQKLVDDLSGYVKDAFSHEYGTDMICFKDMPSHIKSVEHMVIDGAKGSYSKLEDYAKYLGVEYERVPETVDPNQPIDLSTVKDLGKPKAVRQDDLDVQYATSVKAFGTGIAGMFSQRGILALRNECPKSVLELTYPVTQGALQSKHDALDAKRRYALMMGPIRELWKGTKLDEIKLDSGATAWKVATSSNGDRIKATPEEFQKAFVSIFGSKDGMNVPVNSKYIANVSQYLTDKKTNKMMDIEADGRSKLAAPLDKMAYGGTFEDLKDMAAKGTDLFEGRYNSHFTPSLVRKNVNLAKQDKEVVSLAKDDVNLDYDVDAVRARKLGGSIAQSVKTVQRKHTGEYAEDVKAANAALEEARSTKPGNTDAPPK